MRALLAALVLLAGPALAVGPGEALEDPALEARAREISAELRCPICRNESIDESNADVARDIRLLVRERLLAGDSDEAVMDHVVARYGEFILLRPTADGANLVLWLAGPAMLLAGLGIGWVAVRRRSSTEAPLSEAERARLRDLLDG
jgi:cytochrome c-type biogenesis protein CcmH